MKEQKNSSNALLLLLFLAVGLGLAVPLTIQIQTAFADCTIINDEPTFVCAGGGSTTDQGINGGGGGNAIYEGDIFTGSFSGGHGNGDVPGGEGGAVQAACRQGMNV